MEEKKIIVSVMEEKRHFDPPEDVSSKAYIKSLAEYKQMS